MNSLPFSPNGHPVPHTLPSLLCEVRGWPGFSELPCLLHVGKSVCSLLGRTYLSADSYPENTQWLMGGQADRQVRSLHLSPALALLPAPAVAL